MSFEDSRFRLLALIACWLAALLVGARSASGEISCLNEDGKSVDWYIGYKFPKVDSTNQNFSDGLAYAYITSETVGEIKEFPYKHQHAPDSRKFLSQFKELLLKYVSPRDGRKTRIPEERSRGAANSPRWFASSRAISDPGSVILRTLAPAFVSYPSELNRIFYNDDPPNDCKKNNNRAHAKGVLLMDEETSDGVWLTHSMPKFPNARGQELDYPMSATNFGQTFMCISFNLEVSGRQIIDHLVNMRPLIYDDQISDWMTGRFPNLNNLDLTGTSHSRNPVFGPKLSQIITTKGGQVLNLFAKSSSFHEDIYDDWLNSELGADLLVETWRNGRGDPLESSCHKNHYHTNNILDLKYDDRSDWSYKKDHSKWAISDKNTSIVCIGDLNRMASQFRRGGGAVCITCPKCWNIFSNTIKDSEPCHVK